MIEEVSLEQVSLLLNPGATLPNRYPFTISIFRPKFQSRSWYAFDETNLSTMSTSPFFIFHESVIGEMFYSVGWGYKEPYQPVMRQYSNLTDEDGLRIARYEIQDSRIYWNSQGLIWAHYYSDFLITNMTDRESLVAFGLTMREIYSEIGPLASFHASEDYISPETKSLLEASYEELRQEIEATW